MIRSLVRAVIHDAHVTNSGGVSLSIDAFILRAAEILPFEAVTIVNPATGDEVSTWIEAAGEGSGEVSAPSGARKGDTISIVCYAQLHEGQTLDHKPRVVRLDANNRVIAAT